MHNPNSTGKCDNFIDENDWFRAVYRKITWQKTNQMDKTLFLGVFENALYANFMGWKLARKYNCCNII